MRPPFPGMDPYLEHPALWPDVHNRLIASIAVAITPMITPRYYVGLERRIYFLLADEREAVGRPDLAVITAMSLGLFSGTVLDASDAGLAVLDVEIPMPEQVNESYLELREVGSHRVVTVIELLSPANKIQGAGRQAYTSKREAVFASDVNLVEVDLLRPGLPMEIVGNPPRCDYRILVSRAARRPRARLYGFGVGMPIPVIAVPLETGEAEPILDLGDVLRGTYQRARFDLRLDYHVPPVPPLPEPDAAWAAGTIAAAISQGLS